jgi:hypothetical protein
MTTWEPLDLDAVLSGRIEAEKPTRLRREDGAALIYPGRLHTLVGEPSNGKTWVAVAAVAEALNDERVAVVVDLEDSPRIWVERLRRVGVDDKALALGLRYIRPSERLRQEQAADLVPVLDESPALIVVDAFSGLLALEGADPNAAADVERTYARVLRPMRECGAAVLLLDHVVKSREGRGRWATGSERKLSALDGAGYVLESVRPFGRGRTGHGRLRLAKDRLGEVGAAGDVVAEVLLTDHDGGVRLRITPPEDNGTGDSWRPTALMARVSRVLAESGVPMTSNQVVSAVSGKADYVRKALAALVDEGYATATDGPRGSRLHHYVAEFLDPEAVA